MASTIDGPRLVRPEEFRETMRLAENCFGFERGGLERRMPHCFDVTRPDRHAVVERNGKIVSHVACVPVELRAGEASVACHGIAGVATDPDHRGNGYMTQLLEFWLERIADAGAPLAELEGDRVGYGRFGWENAGREYRYRISRRSFDATRVDDARRGDEVRLYRGDEADLDLVERLHESERYRVTRDRDRYERLLGQHGLETLLVDGDEPAYISYRNGEPTSILEFGGSEIGVATLLDRLLGDDADVTVYTHPHHPLASLFTDVATEWSCIPHRKLNVLDLAGLIEAYEPLLEERWLATIDERGGEGLGSIEGTVTLGIVDDDRYPPAGSNADGIRLEYDDRGVRVERTDRDPDIALGRRTMTRLLFGLPDAYRTLKRVHPFLGVVLPLEYYFWQTETI